MVGNQVATTEPDVDLMYPVGVDHGEWAHTFLRACTLVPGAVAELYYLSEVSQAILPEEGTCPFLRGVSTAKTPGY